jgi:hypothetical protein
MDINNAMSTAVNGIRSGMNGLDRNTAEVARASKGEGGDIATPLVESKLNQLQVEANVNMVKTLDETLGSLLDVKA